MKKKIISEIKFTCKYFLIITGILFVAASTTMICLKKEIIDSTEALSNLKAITISQIIILGYVFLRHRIIIHNAKVIDNILDSDNYE